MDVREILHNHLVDDEVLLARFRREAEIAGRLGSENIVEVIDIDRDGEDPFIVLELLEGESLEERIRARGRLDPDELADTLDQVAAGLDVAHGAGVVHRDLKPENIILTEDAGRERAVIVDFGVSKIRGNATAITREVALLGTPDFMSPEQAVGHVEEVGAAADIYALGAVAYYALTGSRPFRASSIPALLRRICDEEPVPLAAQRPELGDRGDAIAAVVAIAMAKDAGERYDAAAELSRDLRRAAEGTLPADVVARAAAVRRGAPASPSVGDRAVSAHDATVDTGDVTPTDETLEAPGEQTG